MLIKYGCVEFRIVVMGVMTQNPAFFIINQY